MGLNKLPGLHRSWVNNSFHFEEEANEEVEAILSSGSLIVGCSLSVSHIFRVGFIGSH